MAGEDDDYDERLAECIKAVHAKYDADVLVYSGPIARPWDDDAIDRVQAGKSHTNLLVFITTFGGDADAAFRMARAFRSRYKKVTAVISGYCKSAGTLLVLGADEVVMLGHAELGPLDIQFFNQNEWGESSSGLAPTQAILYLNNNMAMSFEALFVHMRRTVRLSTKMASDVSRRMVSSVYSDVFSQLDPLRLGETQRAVAVAVQYGKRLIDQSEICDENTLNRLVSGYPSHEFVIDAVETKRLFGDKCRDPHPEETALEEKLHFLLRTPLLDGRTKPFIELLKEETDHEPKAAGPAASVESSGGSPPPNGPAPATPGDGSAAPS